MLLTGAVMLSKCDRIEKISICPFRLEARHLVMTEDHEISFLLSGAVIPWERVLAL